MTTGFSLRVEQDTFTEKQRVGDEIKKYRPGLGAPWEQYPRSSRHKVLRALSAAK